jgi:methylenetetrahydrofolate dehydrogenase (NADP+)/methenyltetrahydrofolate cyclohydrolase
MTKYFDGREFAKKKEAELKLRVEVLVKQGVIPKLVSILVGDDSASALYINLKKKAAERIGAEVVIKKFGNEIEISQVIDFISEANNDVSVHGIMVQLPLPEKFSKEDRDMILNAISRKKDVDGLRETSKFMTPTVKSVLAALENADEFIVRPKTNYLVVGYTGFEGGKIFQVLKNKKLNVIGADSKTKDLAKLVKNADILISATGSPGIITTEMIKPNTIIIDVGAPKGDVDEPAYIKASFVSPVPGGVGPVTISCLLENLLQAASRL